MMEFLPWDSEFFGFGVGRLHASSLTPDVVSSAKHWCRANQVSCLYYLGAPATAQDTPEGFRWVDERVTYQWDPPPETQVLTQPTPSVRPFESADLPVLEALARCSHRDSRFYHDSRFNRERCDELYATWIRRSCEGGDGWADAVFVATGREQPVGYISCGGNSIGLAAVAAGAQGRGLGTQLVTAAQQYFHAKGARRVEVVTQGRNQAARRLYLSCGFQVARIQHWYHLHV